MHVTDKIPPYKTPAGVEIGKFYEPPGRKNFSYDEERIQRAFLNDPLGDGLEDLGRMVLLCLAAFIALIVFFAWVSI